MAPTFGEVIARRDLIVRDAPRRKIVVSVGKPRPDGADWECPFRVKGAGVDILEYGRGVDSMQALADAIVGIRHVLDRTGLLLGWRDVDPENTGFERTIPTFLGAPLARRLERLVEEEIERHAKKLEARHKRRAAEDPRKARRGWTSRPGQPRSEDPAY